jgi:hypothetical protein
MSANGTHTPTITRAATGCGRASSESRRTPVLTAEALSDVRTSLSLPAVGRVAKRAIESAEAASASAVAPNAITRYTVTGCEYSHEDPAHAGSTVAPTTAAGITAR